jgi:hypothetical protein
MAEKDRSQATDDRILAYLGIVTALVAIWFSADQADAGRTIPFQSTLYETRVAAMEEYAKAHFAYDNSLRAFLADVPHPIGTPREIGESNDTVLKEDAKVAIKVRDDYASYTASLNAVIALWPDDVQQAIGDAGKKAIEASQCVFILGAKTLDNGTFDPKEEAQYWMEVRTKAAGACAGINDHEKIIAFQRTGVRALNLMRAQLRKTQNDLVPKRG